MVIFIRLNNARLRKIADLQIRRCNYQRVASQSSTGLINLVGHQVRKNIWCQVEVFVGNRYKFFHCRLPFEVGQRVLKEKTMEEQPANNGEIMEIKRQPLKAGLNFKL